VLLIGRLRVTLRKGNSGENTGNHFDRRGYSNRNLGAFGFQTRDRVLDAGPIHITRETTHSVPYGPLAGAILAIAGVVLLVRSKP
jgi:hypothetical protein